MGEQRSKKVSCSLLLLHLTRNGECWRVAYNALYVQGIYFVEVYVEDVFHFARLIQIPQYQILSHILFYFVGLVSMFSLVFLVRSVNFVDILVEPELLLVSLIFEMSFEWQVVKS